MHAMDLTHVQFKGKLTMRRARVRSAPHATPEPVGPADPVARVTVSGLPALVLSRAGLDARAYRAGPLTRRIAACLRGMRVESESAARARLEARPELNDVALSTLLIGATEFFRDAVVFDTIRGDVISALRERPGPLRIWSLGCSTGAELYSIAIMLAQADLLHRAHLLGTDCRTDAVTSARAGVFSNEMIQDLDDTMRARYFERTRSGCRIVETLRRHTEWRVADATCEVAERPWDLVLCRNVVIYLQRAVAETMFRRIAERLVPGGFLVVGKAERPLVSLGLAEVGRSVYQRHVH